MNKVKIAIFTISIIISLIGIKKLIYINQFKDLKNKEESFLNESKMCQEELIFLKRKISDSRQDLEILYLMKIQ